MEQYRYPVEKRYWEIPQGSWESDAESGHQVVAAGELREETDLIAKKLTYIGHGFQAYEYSNQGIHVHLASDFDVAEQQLDDEEQGMITKQVSITEFESMIAEGLIKDATTISAYALAKINLVAPT